MRFGKKILKLLQQLFCFHLDLPENRKVGGVGYVYQCPKCGAYIGYSKEYDCYLRLRKKDYDEYISLFVGEDSLSWRLTHEN